MSAALHAALLVLAVLLTREQAKGSRDEQPPRPADPARQVEMVYLPPPPPATPRPPTPPLTPKPPAPKPPPAPPRVPQASAPPPEKEQRTPEPDANAPPDAARAEGEEPDEPQPAADAAAAATMESEARRIFGRPRLGTAPGAGPRASRPMEAYLPDHPERCIPKPAAPRDAGAAPEFGVVQGKIFRQDNGKPLSGAHLQMLGTPYVSFTDDGGEYRFRFDLSLVDNCRTQYVRVTAPGYESRLLVLMIGPNVRSEDVLLKRR